jgi:Astacin (Peptidase family M12A)
MLGRQKVLLFSLLLTCGLACAASSPFLVAIAQTSNQNPAQPALPTGISIERLFGTALRNSKWPSKSIDVCWENATPADDKFQKITQAAIQQTWEKNSSVRFNGWSQCSSGASGIHIQISDQAAETLGIGKYLDKRPNGMILNYKFVNWGPSCQANLEFCIYAISVHEFGHALGFTHEQNRDDAPPECKKDQQGIHGDYLLTKYDPESVMNYCNKQWLGNGQLSKWDIVSLQEFYGH